MEVNDSLKKKERNQALRIIRRGDILLLAAIVLMMAALLIWMFFGYVENSVSYVGIFTAAEDTVEVHQEYSGVITSVNIQDGDFVEAGDVIATIFEEEDTTDIPDLSYMKANSQDIVSEVTGIVTNVNVTEWDKVDVTDTIAVIKEDYESDMDDIYIVVNTGVLETILKNKMNGSELCDEIRVTTEVESDNVLTAYVANVDPEPVDREKLTKLLGVDTISDSLADEMFSNDSRYVVLLKANTEDFTWNIHKPCYGEECEVRLVLSRKRPIDSIF